MSVFEQIVKTRHIPHWLFDKGTRVVEVLNSLFLIGFATTFIYNFEGILSLPSYKAFALGGSGFQGPEPFPKPPIACYQQQQRTGVASPASRGDGLPKRSPVATRS